MEIFLFDYPGKIDWVQCRLRALITTGRKLSPDIKEPDDEWKRRILNARHSPIRALRFSFLFINVPGNTATHFVRHVHSQPYVSSLRNDRQNKIDGDKAPRDTPVNMILDVNAEELMVMANKRLCAQAAPKTRQAMKMMCDEVIHYCPEFKPFLVPMCEYHGGVCHEMKPCGKCQAV